MIESMISKTGGADYRKWGFLYHLPKSTGQKSVDRKLEPHLRVEPLHLGLIHCTPLCFLLNYYFTLASLFAAILTLIPRHVRRRSRRGIAVLS